MTEDALAEDRLITMIQISPPPKGRHWAEPVPIEEVGCLGRIIQHERLPDGRFNFLLLGRKRVRMNKRGQHRQALPDGRGRDPRGPGPQPAGGTGTGGADRAVPEDLMKSHHELDPDLAEPAGKGCPWGCYPTSSAMPLSSPGALKQRLLAETSVDRRVDTLRTVLQQVTAAGGLARPSLPPSAPIDRPRPLDFRAVGTYNYG